MLVELLMTKQVVTIAGSQSIADAEQLLMENNLRRIPVVENQRVVGIICDTDIIKAKPSILDPTDDEEEVERCSLLTVDHIMTDNPVTVNQDAPIEEAVLKMRLHKINSIPVVKDGLMVGIITETNIFNTFLKVVGAETPGTRVEMLVEQDSAHFYSMLDVFRQHDMEIAAVTMYPEFSKEHKMVTVKTQGDNLDELLNELWERGVKINRVLKK